MRRGPAKLPIGVREEGGTTIGKHVQARGDASLVDPLDIELFRQHGLMPCDTKEGDCSALAGTG